MSLAKIILHALFFIDKKNEVPPSNKQSALLDADRFFPSIFHEYDDADDHNASSSRLFRVWPQLASVAFMSFGFRNSFVPRIVSLTRNSFSSSSSSMIFFNTDLDKNILVSD